MTRQELLKIAKPIRMNTEDVRAILDGRKTVTRRPCKIKINGGKPVTHGLCDIAEYPETNIDGLCANFYDNERFYKGCAKPICRVGDYLYVRETWSVDNHNWLYRADFSDTDLEKLKNIMRWGPSIHMPKKIARIFLRVTDVRVERLQDITKDGVIAEGTETDEYLDYEEWATAVAPPGSRMITLRDYFSELWDSTVKKSDLAKYGWDANPFVWVIEFERVEVEP